MKLSKAQLQYIGRERAKMAQREKYLDTFGDDIYKSAELSAEKSRIGFRRWYLNMLIELHNVEVEAEKESVNIPKAKEEKIFE